jgi:hypothetical protein
MTPKRRRSIQKRRQRQRESESIVIKWCPPCSKSKRLDSASIQPGVKGSCEVSIMKGFLADKCKAITKPTRCNIELCESIIDLGECPLGFECFRKKLWMMKRVRRR